MILWRRMIHPMKLVNNVVEFLSSPSPVVHHWCVALICGSPLCGPTLCGSPPPSVNLHLNVSQAFVPARPPPPSVYWSRFFDNFPGLSNIWGSPRPSLAHGSGAVLRMSLLWVWGQTVGFVTAKWLYLRWDCPLRSGTILTTNSSLGVKAATHWCLLPLALLYPSWCLWIKLLPGCIYCFQPCACVWLICSVLTKPYHCNCTSSRNCPKGRQPEGKARHSHSFCLQKQSLINIPQTLQDLPRYQIPQIIKNPNVSIISF